MERFLHKRKSNRKLQVESQHEEMFCEYCYYYCRATPGSKRSMNTSGQETPKKVLKPNDTVSTPPRWKSPRKD